MELKGKVAIVTGGTRGIGRAITEALVRAGLSVSIGARSRSEIDAAVGELTALDLGRVTGFVCDVELSQVKSLFELTVLEFGGLDILVNNAGIGIFTTVEEMRQKISALSSRLTSWEFTIVAMKRFRC